MAYMYTMSGLCWACRPRLAVRPRRFDHVPLASTYNLHNGVIVLLRVYALYDRSRRVLGVLLLLGVVDFIIAIVCLFPQTFKWMYACLTIFSPQSRPFS